MSDNKTSSKASLSVDQNPQTGVTESKGTRVQSTSKVVNAERDEELTLLADGRRINMSVDRNADGDFEIRGRSGDGRSSCQI